MFTFSQVMPSRWAGSYQTTGLEHVDGVSKYYIGNAYNRGFPGITEGKESACNARDLGSILGSGRSPGEGRGNPLQYSCLENSMDRGAWQDTVHGVTKSQTQLSD